MHNKFSVIIRQTKSINNLSRVQHCPAGLGLDGTAGVLDYAGDATIKNHLKYANFPFERLCT